MSKVGRISLKKAKPLQQATSKLLTTSEVAERLGVTVLTVGKWKNGINSSAPKLPYVLRKEKGVRTFVFFEEDVVLGWLEQHRPDLAPLWKNDVKGLLSIPEEDLSPWGKRRARMMQALVAAMKNGAVN